MSSLDSSPPHNQEAHQFFFYGPLCASQVLARVLGHKCEKLTFQDALLPGYTRHRVKGKAYPAVIEHDASSQTSDTESQSDPSSTRGTLVHGLTNADAHALDLFEDDGYTRRRVLVRALTHTYTVGNLAPALLDPTSREGEGVEGAARKDQEDLTDSKMFEASVYVWSDVLDRLEPEVWDFQSFTKAKKDDWNNLPVEWYEFVDKGRTELASPNSASINSDQNGKAQDEGSDEGLVGRQAEGYDDFGHNLLKHWAFSDGYVNLNHGSYGSPPLPVISASNKLSTQIESNPDKFMKRDWLPILQETNRAVAGIIGAQESEVVIVPNATHGIFNIVDTLKWEPGDVIVYYNTTHGAVSQMLKYVADSRGITLHPVNINFPVPHSTVIEETAKVLDQFNEISEPHYTGQPKATGKGDGSSRVKLIVVDALSSNPGLLFPWQEIVQVAKRYGVLSLVDGAHAIGQIESVEPLQMAPLTLPPNCHKWLMSRRSGAVLYVPTRNQYLIRTSIPTSAGYESTKYPTPGVNAEWAWATQYRWTGTQDWTPFFSILPAIEFRKNVLGGEKRIMEWCHSLAVAGSKRLKQRWGADAVIMDTPTPTLTAAMSNITLPHIPPPTSFADQAQQAKFLEDGMFEANCFAPCYMHAGKWWVRFSAQVWNELSDFDYIGGVLEDLCLKIKNGEHLKQAEVVEAAKNAPKQPVQVE
ncbi:hypothetical protein I350_05044 [Cryptococcus amylolentus CBS 6273]|uniref:Aminotransferase class V domain-containing protein n=1 Tax=Cryptococcus amylolentus CBS 6273 TaxID=1296118 RepID=A0A1E3JYT8_9TREE|nr:hypothetical protein I350_05044 [Cryptococcus amylolentus CBS 6273]